MHRSSLRGAAPPFGRHRQAFLVQASRGGRGRHTRSESDNQSQAQQSKQVPIQNSAEEVSGTQKQQARDDTQKAAELQPDGSSGQLPQVPTERILNACVATSVAIGAAGLLLRLAAGSAGPMLFRSDPAAVASLLQFSSFEGWHLLVAGAAAATVTGARQTLLIFWPDFAEATNRSNQQVLAQLQTSEVFVVACIPAAAEEVLFRGGLIPFISPDWRGVAVAGAAFGLLHNSGGRNWSFAAWAAAVGALYGAVFVSTRDLVVPVMAHASANLASAFLWRRANLGESKSL